LFKIKQNKVRYKITERAGENGGYNRGKRKAGTLFYISGKRKIEFYIFRVTVIDIVDEKI
jgi:hypothetical protein